MPTEAEIRAANAARLAAVERRRSAFAAQVDEARARWAAIDPEWGSRFAGLAPGAADQAATGNLAREVVQAERDLADATVRFRSAEAHCRRDLAARARVKGRVAAVATATGTGKTELLRESGDTLTEVRRRRGPEPVQETVETPEERDAHLERIVQRAVDASLLDPRAIERVGMVLAEATSSVAIESQLQEARDLVTAANRFAARRASEATTASELLDRLVGSSGPVVEGWRTHLESVIVGVTTLDPDAVAGVEAARAAAHFTHIAEVLQEELEAMGYEVAAAPDIATGRTYARRPAWSDVGRGDSMIRLTHDPEGRLVTRAAVTVASSDRAATTEVERQWCDDFRELRERAAARGVELEVLKASAPGDMDPLVEEQPFPDEVSTGAARPKAAARRRPAADQVRRQS